MTSGMFSCQCLLGYENTGDNTCTKIPGMFLHPFKSYDLMICRHDKYFFLETDNFLRAIFNVNHSYIKMVQKSSALHICD